MPIKKKSEILIFDIESAGVQGLKADRSILVCFGFKWLGDKAPQVLTIADYPGNDCQDDKPLLKEAYKVLSQAEGLVAHFGENFDKPYLQAKLLQAGLDPIPAAKLTDTCLLVRRHLCLSSSRLSNVADFLKVKTRKMNKGDGWPSWWMGALNGDKASIKKMAAYCAIDVQCLEECYLALRHIIPTRYLPINAAVGQAAWTCAACGGHRYQHRGSYWSDKSRYQRFQCQGCGRWSHSEVKLDKVPRI